MLKKLTFRLLNISTCAVLSTALFSNFVIYAATPEEAAINQSYNQKVRALKAEYKTALKNYYQGPYNPNATPLETYRAKMLNISLDRKHAMNQQITKQNRENLNRFNQSLKTKFMMGAANLYNKATGILQKPAAPTGPVLDGSKLKKEIDFQKKQ